MENFSPRETDGDSYGDLSKVSSLAPQRKTPSWLGSCETCPFGGRERGNGNEGGPTGPPPPQKSTSRFPWVMVPECVSQNYRMGKIVWEMLSTHSEAKDSTVWPYKRLETGLLAVQGSALCDLIIWFLLEGISDCQLAYWTAADYMKMIRCPKRIYNVFLNSSGANTFTSIFKKLN